MKLRVGVLAAVMVASAVAQAQNVIFDTGVQNVVTFNAALSNLGLSSGNLSGLPERWYAVPFKIAAGGATVNKIWVRGFVPAGFEFANFKVRVWSRSGLGTGPVPANEIDLNGATAGNEVTTPNPGPIEDPRFKAEPYFGAGNDRRLFELTGFTPFSLNEGEYWLSVYASDGIGDQAPFCNFAWFIGAHGDNVSLNREAGFYRQASLAGGFAAYNPTNITPYSFMGDPAERWNACFTLWGTSARTARSYFGELMWNDYVGNAPPYDDATNPKPQDFIYRLGIVDPNNSNAVVAWRYLRTIDQLPVTGDWDTAGSPDFDFSPQYQYYTPVAAPATITNTDLFFKANNYLGVRNTHDLSVNSGDVNRDWNLKNGDVDIDGEVGPGDFGILSAEFGNAAASGTYADWSTWVASAAGQADLDEDGEVGPSDFGILSANFGEADE